MMFPSLKEAGWWGIPDAVGGSSMNQGDEEDALKRVKEMVRISCKGKAGVSLSLCRYPDHLIKMISDQDDI